MFTKEQEGIIKAVSTILFEETGDCDPKDYWTGNKGVFWSKTYDSGEIYVDYRLNYILVETGTYIKIARRFYDEPGEPEEFVTIGLVKVDLKNACWDMYSYCKQIEMMIVHCR